MRNKKSTTNPTKDHEPNNSEIDGRVINVLGEVLGLASCHKRSNHCRYVKGTSPFDITVTSGRLRWHRNQSHTCAPCINIKIRKGEDRRKKKREVLHLFRWYTHTHSSVFDPKASAKVRLIVSHPSAPARPKESARNPCSIWKEQRAKGGAIPGWGEIHGIPLSRWFIIHKNSYNTYYNYIHTLICNIYIYII